MIQVFDDPDQLAEAVNAVMEFDMALPNEVVSLLNDSYNVDVCYVGKRFF